MIHKKAGLLKNIRPYLPPLPVERKIDPFSVFELKSLIGPGPKQISFAEALEKYVGKII